MPQAILEDLSRTSQPSTPKTFSLRILLFFSFLFHLRLLNKFLLPTCRKTPRKILEKIRFDDVTVSLPADWFPLTRSVGHSLPLLYRSIDSFVNHQLALSRFFLLLFLSLSLSFDCAWPALSLPSRSIIPPIPIKTSKIARDHFEKIKSINANHRLALSAIAVHVRCTYFFLIPHSALAIDHIISRAIFFFTLFWQKVPFLILGSIFLFFWSICHLIGTNFDNFWPFKPKFW